MFNYFTYRNRPFGRYVLEDYEMLFGVRASVVTLIAGLAVGCASLDEYSNGTQTVAVLADEGRHTEKRFGFSVLFNMREKGGECGYTARHDQRSSDTVSGTVAIGQSDIVTFDAWNFSLKCAQEDGVVLRVQAGPRRIVLSEDVQNAFIFSENVDATVWVGFSQKKCDLIANLSTIKNGEPVFIGDDEVLEPGKGIEHKSLISYVCAETGDQLEINAPGLSDNLAQGLHWLTN